MMTPLHVGVEGAISNEFGAVLSGNAGAPGSLVLLLWASNSVIYPPAVDGQSHAGNPPVSGGASAIGYLTSPTLTQPGTFAMSLGDPRPPTGSKVFVRVFNGADAASSSFYGDSQIFTVSDNKEFEARIGGTTNPLDVADDDGDGLHNSWEESYGTDPDRDDTDEDGLSDLAEVQMGVQPTVADSDGDGVIDGHEWRAGTGLLDKDSFLGMAELTPAENDLVLRWASVTGHAYQVESAPGDLAGSPAFSNITEVIQAAPGDVTETTLTNALQAIDLQVFRVRLVEEP